MGEITLPHDKGWTRLGPGGGGSMFSPVASPHDPKTAIITCDMTGQYVTRDGGRTWSMCNLMIHVDTFAFDPVEERIYAGANALYATDDFGKNWQMVWPSAGTPRETILKGDEASAVYVGGDWPQRRISALAIDRTNHQRILAGLSGSMWGGGTDSDLYLSEDRGRSWRKLAALPGHRVQKLALDPNAPHVMWAVTNDGLFRSRDRGANWSQLVVPDAGRLTNGDIGFTADGHTYSILLLPRKKKEGKPASSFLRIVEKRGTSPVRACNCIPPCAAGAACR